MCNRPGDAERAGRQQTLRSRPGDGRHARLFSGGPIYPMRGGRVDGGVLLTRGGTVAYLGPREGLDESEARGAERVELDGRPLLPGLCDAHVHLVLAAEEHASLDCRGVERVEDLLAFVKERAKQDRAEDGADGWITGSGWERKTLFEDRTPDIGQLDAASPRRPVLLASKDLHSAWLNTAALARLRALDPAPGSVVRPGEGMVFEGILELRRRLVPERSRQEKRALLGPFLPHLYACGITTVHNNEPAPDLELVRDAFARAPSERIRVLWNLVLESPEDLRRREALLEPAVPRWLCPGGIKLFLDGSLGSLTAAVSEPYRGTDARGILSMEEPELMAWLRALHAAGTHGVFHVIGDRAAALLLDGLARLPWPAKTRHRLEHAQLLPAAVRARDLSHLVFSVQPSHMWGDREIVARHLPPGLAGGLAYAYRTMQERGGIVVFGSDAPVEDVDPWRGIQAAVTRLADADPPWRVDEALSVHDAIAAHTAGPARVHGRCLPGGTLAPGAAADLVVLEDDPFVRPTRALGATRTSRTYLDGELVFAR